MYQLTPDGRKYARSGMPEYKLVQLARKKTTSIEEARKTIDDFSIALSWAKRLGCVSIEKNTIKFVKDCKDQSEALRRIERKEQVEDQVLAVLIQRNLVEKVRDDIHKIAEKQLMSAAKGGRLEIGMLTPEIIMTRKWDDSRVTFKPYNVSAPGRTLYPGKKHILTYYTEKIRRILLDLGFTEAEGPFVESSFWNFDALFQPQDHPARELADTFFMSEPKESKLPERFLNSVRKAHESGTPGSTGWGYKWSEAIAKKPILRTHNTAVSARSLAFLTQAGIKPPIKSFCISRVFRNETIDYKHLPEFTQIDGIVADESVSFRNLLGYLKELYNRLGFEKIRFRPAYFPYTEMSTEVEVYFEDKKEWLELGGSGIFRPEVTEPLGINVPVLAWGVSLERPIILKLGLNDIRNFYYKNDLKMLRSTPVWQ